MDAARRKEATKVSTIFHAALTALGADAAIDALDDWQDVANTPDRIVTSVARFLVRALSLVTVYRREARELALVYLRYHRALHTGYTFSGATGDDLAALREEFYSEVQDTVPGLLEPSGAMVDDETGEVIVEAPDDFDFEVTVEDLPEYDEGALEDLSEDILRDKISEGAVASLKRHQPSTSRPATEVDSERDEAHEIAGSIVGMAVQREVLGGGREPVKEIGKKDKRVLGFVRVSKTGTPCGFCAMLISRGPVYKSAKSATQTTEGAQYHAGCNCIEIEVYSQEQYDEDPRFDLNRELQKEWPGVTKGRSGKAALKAWRKHIRQKYPRPDQESA